MGDGGTVRHPSVRAVSPAALDEAVRVLRAGGLVAFPTETVYGLGADAANPAAVARIFAAKGRPADHPLIVHVASAESARDWAATFPPLARTLADAFWPGPLTLILPRSAQVPDAVTGGRATVGCGPRPAGRARTPGTLRRRNRRTFREPVRPSEPDHGRARCR